MASYSGALEALKQTLDAQRRAEEEQMLKGAKRGARRRRRSSDRLQADRDAWREHRADDEDCLDRRLPGSLGTGKKRNSA